MYCSNSVYLSLKSLETRMYYFSIMELTWSYCLAREGEVRAVKLEGSKLRWFCLFMTEYVSRLQMAKARFKK